MTGRFLRCLCLAALLALPLQAKVKINGQADTRLDGEIKQGMTLLYQENFTAAIRLFTKIQKRYPDHPVGYFLLAAALDAQMYFYYTARMERKFMKHCETAVEKGEQLMQQRPDDTWLRFFTGGAYGYMGTFQARYKRYITAFRNGFAGVSMLKDIYKMDSGFTDVLFGLGTYNYWSSRLSKALWWMPGLSDKRQLGIDQLKKTIAEGHYTAYPAAGNLMWIYMEEKRYNEGLAIADKMLGIYPNNRIFSFGKATILFHMGRLDESETIFRYILDMNDAETRNNHVNTLRCRSFLARIYAKKKIWYKALAECRRGLSYKYNENDEIIAKEYRSEINTVLKTVQKNFKLKR